MVEEPEITYTGSINNAEIIGTVRPLQETIKGRGLRISAYGAIARSAVGLDAWANSLPVLRSLITNVLFSPSVAHGPRGTSLNSTKRQSVTSVSFNPR